MAEQLHRLDLIASGILIVCLSILVVYFLWWDYRWRSKQVERLQEIETTFRHGAVMYLIQHGVNPASAIKTVNEVFSSSGTISEKVIEESSDETIRRHE